MSGDDKGEPPRRKSSGQHEAVVEFKRVLQEMKTETLPAIDETNKRLEAALSTAPGAMSASTEQQPAIVIPGEELRGTWTITIHGEGPHHNLQATDANRLSSRFVRMLRDSGQKVLHASFTNGSEESLHDKPDEPEPSDPTKDPTT